MSISFEFAKKYHETIELSIANKIAEFGSTKLSAACAYALKGGGKRFRPALVYLIADSLGHKRDVTEAAIAIEFFHTSSLIADDLPCMDNEDFRRNRPSLHKVFGETTALLASYALIAAGYDAIRLNAKSLRSKGFPRTDEICVLALENATLNTGILGATGGQFLDLFPPPLDEKTLQDCIQKKTCSLFEIAFVFGWLFGGGSPEYLTEIKQAAHHFGFAFQIIDDFQDLKDDRATGKKSNFVDYFGETEARKILGEQMRAYQSLLKTLSLESIDLLKSLDF